MEKFIKILLTLIVLIISITLFKVTYEMKQRRQELLELREKLELTSKLECQVVFSNED